MILALIRSLFIYNRKKFSFPYINILISALFFYVLFPVNIHRSLYPEMPDNAYIYANAGSYSDLPFIQPFTSLAGFNWKFGKDKKKRYEETRVTPPSAIYLPHLFRK